MNNALAFAMHEMIWMMDLVADDILKERHGVSFVTGRMLMVVSDLQPCSQRRVADCLWVSAPAITKTLPFYVENGWIDVEVDPKQPRRNLLRLTPKGQELADACKSTLESEFQKLLEHCGVSTEAFGRDIQAVHAELSAATSHRKEMNK